MSILFISTSSIPRVFPRTHYQMEGDKEWRKGEEMITFKEECAEQMSDKSSVKRRAMKLAEILYEIYDQEIRN